MLLLSCSSLGDWSLNVLMIEAKRRKAVEYKTESGVSPFSVYLKDLKDRRGAAKITRAVKKMEEGNFGDHKSIADGDGLYECRLDIGPGYRIYYIVEGDRLLILFGASDKKGQQKAIDKARDYAADYKSRSK
jgi:putative addiction module killer protein